MNLIVACDSNYGIGLNNKLPWHSSTELKLFKTKTHDSVLIMGRKTVDFLPPLPNRTVIVLTRDKEYKSDLTIEHSLDSAIAKAENLKKPIFFAGGAEIYLEVLKRGCVNKIYLSQFKTSYNCDRFFPNIFLTDFTIESEQDYEEFVHRVYVKKHTDEHSYLKLLFEVANASIRIGRNGPTSSLFGKTLTFNLLDGFPLLTTKKMFFRGIVEELLFFWRGQTDSKELEKKNINIWKLNTNREFLDSIGQPERREGLMGPMYGYQWRFFNANYDQTTGNPTEKGYDQLAEVIKSIKTNPTSRRLILTDYNPLQAEQGVLFPCHSLMIQFYVDEKFLDMTCYNRSQDLFLGTPFNIASSALFLSLVAKLTNLQPRYLYMFLGDVHIYSQHSTAVNEQLQRSPYRFPYLVLPEVATIEDVENLTFDDFKLTSYLHHSEIKAKMVA